jgi:S1-C subfamily serine protease
MTSGIVSALGRDVPVPTQSGAQDVLPGAVPTEGIGFAIPVGVAGRLIERGRFMTAYFGALTTPIASVVDVRYQRDGG